MGWLGYPKYRWRQAGFIVAIVGAYILLTSQTSGGLFNFNPPTREFGFFLLILGLIINVLNG
jgi:hypothetical protein